MSLSNEEMAVYAITAASLYQLFSRPLETTAEYEEKIAALYRMWLEQFGPDYMTLAYNKVLDVVEGASK